MSPTVQPENCLVTLVFAVLQMAKLSEVERELSETQKRLNAGKKSELPPPANTSIKGCPLTSVSACRCFGLLRGGLPGGLHERSQK